MGVAIGMGYSFLALSPAIVLSVAGIRTKKNNNREAYFVNFKNPSFYALLLFLSLSYALSGVIGSLFYIFLFCIHILILMAQFITIYFIGHFINPKIKRVLKNEVLFLQTVVPVLFLLQMLIIFSTGCVLTKDYTQYLGIFSTLPKVVFKASVFVEVILNISLAVVFIDTKKQLNSSLSLSISIK